jgi:hypothetical protein
MLKSSPMIVVPRYASGTSKRAPSAVYTTQWPFTATEDNDDAAEHSLAALAVVVRVSLFLPMAVILCHFLAI